MLQSAGIRFIVVGALALLMFIPLGLVSDVIQERVGDGDLAWPERYDLTYLGEELGGRFAMKRTSSSMNTMKKR